MKVCKREDGALFPYSEERAAKKNFTVVEIETADEKKAREAAEAEAAESEKKTGKAPKSPKE